MIDLAYPVHPTLEVDWEQLRYSLRSAQTNFTALGNVYLAGKKPDWCQSVVYLPTVQDSTKGWNIGRNLQAVLDSPISDPFVWMNVDFFFLKPMATVPLIDGRGPFDQWVERLPPPRDAVSNSHEEFIKGVTMQRDQLRAWGYDTSVMGSTCCHFPLLIDKERIARVLAALPPDHPTGFFRGLYGAIAWSDGVPLERRLDCKLTELMTIPPSWEFVSTSESSWRRVVGNQLRAMFPHPSRYEMTGL